MDKAERAVLEEGRLRFAFKAADRYSVGMLNAERHTVETLAAQILGQPVRVEVTTRESEPAGAAAPAVDEKVEMVKRVFKGQLVDGG